MRFTHRSDGAIGGQKGVLIAAMVAAWFSVLLASGAFAIELAASGHGRNFFQMLTWMALVHAVIGIGEAMITGLVVRFLLLRRPDLFEARKSDRRDNAMPGGAGARRPRRAGGARWPWLCFWRHSLRSPDGLEFVGQQLDVPAG